MELAVQARRGMSVEDTMGAAIMNCDTEGEHKKITL